MEKARNVFSIYITKVAFRLLLGVRQITGQISRISCLVPQFSFSLQSISIQQLKIWAIFFFHLQIVRGKLRERFRLELLRRRWNFHQKWGTYSKTARNLFWSHLRSTMRNISAQRSVLKVVFIYFLLFLIFTCSF